MFTWNKLFFAVLITAFYAFGMQFVLGFAPLSFEDHFIWTQLLALIVIFALWKGWLHPKLNPMTTLLFYGVLIASHFGWQLLVSIWGLPVCHLAFGITWYGVLELPSLFLLGALAFAFQHWFQSKWYAMLGIVGVVVFFGLFNVVELLNQPTMSFLHPTVGYFPGPLYDTWIPITQGVINARVMSVALGVFVLLAVRWPKYLLLLPVLLLSLFARPQMLWLNTHITLQHRMKHHQQTDFVHIYSQDKALSPSERASIDYYVTRITQKLDLPLPDQKINMYLYQDPQKKKIWTGTHYTMIGNPRQKTMHILGFSTWSTLLVHELTHVLASSMKKNILSMPINPLLTEGLAMYIQEHRGAFDLNQWAKAIITFRESQNKKTSIDMLNGMKAFYQSPSSHAYLLAGAWTQYLIETYGLDAYKKYYAGTSPKRSFGKGLDDIQVQWRAHLDKVSLVDQAYQAMAKRLDQKAIFEATCPHELAHAEIKIDACQHKACIDQWKAFAKKCNPNWQYIPAIIPMAPEAKLKDLLAHPPKQQSPQDTYNYQLTLAIAHERNQDLSSALVHARKAQAQNNTRMIQRHIARLEYIIEALGII